MTLAHSRRVRWMIAASIVAGGLAGGVVRRGDLRAATGPVAAFGFEENAGTRTADASGNGNWGVLVGSTWTTQGKFGNALVFDGTTSRVTLVNDSPLLRLTTAMTLEAWVKPSTVTSAWRDVIYKGNDNYYLEGTSNHGGVPAAGGTFSGTNVATFGSTPLAVNVWSHLAATYDGSFVRLYVNGVQVSSLSRTGSLLTSSSPLQLGGNSYFGQSFAGTIDEVRVYDRALSQAEIESDRSAPVAPPVADPDPPTAPGTPTATGFSGSEIELTWPPSTDNVGVTAYLVERCRGAECVNFVQVATSAGPGYEDTGLALNTLYSYRVRATDAAGNPSPYSSVSSATTSSTTAVPGLVAAYAFDEGTGSIAGDASGFGNHGTVANAAWTSAGRYGGALQFNGVDASVTIDDSASLHLTTGMTLEAWVDPLAIPPKGCSTPSCPWMDVMTKETDRYYIEASSDLNQQPEAGGIYESGKHIVFAPAPLTPNEWTHLALTYDSAMIRFYVNGAEVASSAETSPLTTSTAPLRIGGDSIFGQYFKGTIDEVRVYSRALTPAELQGDLNTSIGSSDANPTPVASRVEPDTAPAGSGTFILTVLGSGFAPDSLVDWNGADRPTTYVGPTELHAEIPGSDIVSAGTAEVTVFTPPPVGGTSAALPFVVCAGSNEVCNGIDDDCDGLTDDADPTVTGRPTWYRDADGDTYGDSTQSQPACAQPTGYVPTAGDCDDTNGAVWSVPDEAQSLEFLDPTTLHWTAPARMGGSSVLYDTLRADSPTTFDVAGTCSESDGPDTSTADGDTPTMGSGFFFLVRAKNSCGGGSLGASSSGSERIGRTCP